MRNSMVLATALMAGAVISIPLMADPGSDAPPPGMHDHEHQPPLMRALKQISLSDTQQSTIHAFWEADHTQAHAQESELHAARVAYDSAQPGTSDFTSTEATLANAESDAARSRVQSSADLRTKIDGVLTAAQRTQLNTLMIHFASEARSRPSHSPEPS